MRYLKGVTTQIAIRLQDDTVRLMDQAVADGAAKSRASFVEAALQRELRRYLAMRDLEILRRVGPDDELDDLVDWTMKNLPALDE